MRILLLCVALVTAGCGMFRPTFESCDETPAYAGAKEMPRLEVPEGLDLPDTRNALRIPPVTAPERPLNGRCIDAPPSYSADRPQTSG